MSVDVEKSTGLRVETKVTTSQDTKQAAQGTASSATPSLNSIANPRRIRWNVAR